VHSAPSNEELLQLAVESNAGFAVIAFDNNGAMLSWNIGAERLLGYSDEEIAEGLNADVIFTPEDREAGEPEKEREQALEFGRAEDERWHLRKDGTRFWASGLTSPLPNGEGFVKIMRDRTQKRLNQERIQASEARFRTLATNIPELVFSSFDSGARTWASPQWELFTGLSDASSREFGWLEAIHPDDRAATLAAWHEAQQSGSYHVEHRVRRARDGAYRWHQTRAKPLARRNAPLEWVGTSSDIHEMRELQDSQQVLLAELQHRTRNLLAMVQSLARRSARAGGSLQDFKADFESRLRALSRAESLVAGYAGAVEISALIKAELSAHLDSIHGVNRTHVDGPSAKLPASSAQAIALALHELATNAVKYGALGQESGTLAVNWRVDRDNEEPRIVLEWQETGVAMTDHTQRRRGYGSELIQRALPYQLNADTKLEFLPDGVYCRIAVPINDA
jgi:PAS domain S-box-containing protein